MHPVKGGCLLGQLRQESRGVAAENTKFRDCKGNEADVGRLFTPLRTSRTWSSQHGVEPLRETRG
jgi:hypothetical protein